MVEGGGEDVCVCCFSPSLFLFHICISLLYFSFLTLVVLHMHNPRIFYCETFHGGHFCQHVRPTHTHLMLMIAVSCMPEPRTGESHHHGDDTHVVEGIFWATGKGFRHSISFMSDFGFSLHVKWQVSCMEVTCADDCRGHADADRVGLADRLTC